MRLLNIHSVILQNDTYMVYDFTQNPLGITTYGSANFRQVPVHAFWWHRIDEHEPIVYQLFSHISRYGLAFPGGFFHMRSTEELLFEVADSLIWAANRGLG